MTITTPPAFKDISDDNKRIITSFFTDGPITVNNIPDLYQYRQWNEHTRKQLCNEFIWCSKATEFNDPFDSILNLPILRSIVKEYHDCNCTQLNEYNILKLYNDISNERSHMRISCLTPENRNLLMWSHYAKNHEGICIEYDTAQLDTSRKKFCIAPVIYTDDNMALKSSIYHCQTKDCLGKDVIRFSIGGNISLILAMVKGKVWEYEKEYRIFSDEMNFKDGEYSVHWPIKAVYLGLKIKEPDKEEVINIARSRYPVFQAVPSNYCVGLDFNKIL